MYYFIQIDSANKVIAKYKSNHQPTNASNIILVPEQDWSSIEEGYFYDPDTQTFSPPPPPPVNMDALKQELKDKVKSIRKQKENSGVTVLSSDGTSSYQLDTSLTGRANLQGVLNAFQLGLLDQTTDTVHWKFMDGNFADLTYDQLKELAGFALHYVEALFRAESAHYQAIDALATVDELQAYDVNANWPNNEYQSQTL